ncbi:hypothetical protein DFP72DRAFT_1062953 [Ephemerocybe angulata]|uniref:HAM1-like N-terminal domain-containing protein n=1 Tax=Ephemerocybe angulata TaxID=980116 RepID=A0A8H6I7Y6_9AGAR|nr:hypothetical protein DFP72DRAFT_1062953 [Tulosesus angulatus]
MAATTERARHGRGGGRDSEIDVVELQDEVQPWENEAVQTLFLTNSEVRKLFRTSLIGQDLLIIGAAKAAETLAAHARPRRRDHALQFHTANGRTAGLSTSSSTPPCAKPRDLLFDASGERFQFKPALWKDVRAVILPELIQKVLDEPAPGRILTYTPLSRLAISPSPASSTATTCSTSSSRTSHSKAAIVEPMETTMRQTRSTTHAEKSAAEEAIKREDGPKGDEGRCSHCILDCHTKHVPAATTPPTASAPAVPAAPAKHTFAQILTPTTYPAAHSNVTAPEHRSLTPIEDEKITKKVAAQVLESTADRTRRVIRRSSIG